MTAKPYGLAVKAVILDEQGRCLLIRRSAHNHNFVGKWEWPGGKVDKGEDFATAVHREVAEETGLTVELTGLAGSTSFAMPTVNVVLLCMEVRLVSGDVKLSQEHDAVAWVAMGDMPRYEYPSSIADLMLEYAAQKGSRT